MDGMSDYEAVRKANIARNQEFLKSIGLDDLKTSIDESFGPSSASENFSSGRGKAPVKRQKRNFEDLDSGTRRSSRRIAGASIPEGSALGEFDIDNETKRKLREERKKMQQSSFGENIFIDDESSGRKPITSKSVYAFIESHNPQHLEEIGDEDIAHCVNRIHSMSNKALATRIKVITRASGQHSRAKMLVFYYALKACGLEDLAVSASLGLKHLGVEIDTK